MKTQFIKSINLVSILLSLFLGIIISWLIKDIITPLVLSGKVFANRSLFVQIGILALLIVFNSTFFFLILSILNSFYSRNKKLQQLVNKIIFNRNFQPVLIVLITCLIFIFWGEIVREDDGIGWDWKISYVEIVKHLSPNFLSSLGAYRIGRLLPEVIIHYTLRLLNISLETDQIIQAFQIYNIVLLLVGTYFWGTILDELKISAKGCWLGYIGFFINWFILKSYFYVPVGTDQTALVIGIFMLYFFLKQNRIGLLLATIAGAFTWPTLLIGGMCLLIFPKPEVLSSTPAKNNLNEFAAISVTCLFLGGILYNYLIVKKYASDSYGITVHEVVILSILSVISLVYWGTKELFNTNELFDIKNIIKKMNIVWLVIAILTYVGVQTVIKSMGEPDGKTPYSLLQGMFILATIKPFSAFVAHVTYFGPVLIITVFAWKQFSREIHRFGIGLTLFTLFFFIQMAFLPESRMLIPFSPLLIAFTAKATDDFNWSVSELRFIGVVSFLFSRVWITFNVEEWHYNEQVDSLTNFPYQLIFMNYGPWMSHAMYIVFGSFTILTGILFYFLFFKERNFNVRKSDDI